MGRRPGPRTAIVGAGRLARAFAPALERAGYRITAIAARSRTSARALGRRLATPARVAIDAVDAAAGAQLVLLAVPDPAIAPLAERLAAAPGLAWRGRAVLHHAGALGLAPLAPLARAGAAVGVVHPLQCLGPEADRAGVLAGAHARVEGNALGARMARRVARDLGLHAFVLPRRAGERERAAYHAAAALCSNDMLALLALGVDALRAAGLAPRQALAALLPLARGTLAQAQPQRLGAALTGPVVRDDVETLRRHLAALTTLTPLHAEVHRLLSLRLARLVAEHGQPAPTRVATALRRIGPGRKATV